MDLHVQVYFFELFVLTYTMLVMKTDAFYDKKTKKDSRGREYVLAISVL